MIYYYVWSFSDRSNQSLMRKQQIIWLIHVKFDRLLVTVYRVITCQKIEFYSMEYELHHLKWLIIHSLDSD